MKAFDEAEAWGDEEEEVEVKDFDEVKEIGEAKAAGLP